MTKAQATSSAPVDWTRSRQARMVPPVASTSSSRRTRWPGGEGVGVDLEPVVAVLELILLGDRGVGELARLADRHEPGPHLHGQRGAEDEAPGLGRRDDVDASPLEVLLELLDRRAKRLGIAKQRRDVLEHEPGLGKSGMLRM